MPCKGCGKKKGEAAPINTERLVTGRKMKCCFGATECHCICRWLIKAPGLRAEHCAHPNLPAPVKLYDVLRNSDWHCPDHLF